MIAPRDASSTPNGKIPRFLKETAAWKNRTLAEEELAELQTAGAPVSSSLTKIGTTISPVSAGRPHHYEKSTVSSSIMDEKMSARIREIRAANSGSSDQSAAPRDSAILRSRGGTPTNGAAQQRQRPSSAGPRSRPSAPMNSSSNSVHDRLFNAQAEMDKKRELARARRLEQDTKELTFKPTLYSTPPSNLHVRGDVKAVPVSKDQSTTPVTPPTSKAPPGSINSARTPPTRGSVPRSLVGGRPSANQSDVFDRLSKLTTASLQADIYVAPAEAPAFSGGSIVPENHPSLAQMPSHPTYAVSGTVDSAAV